MKLRSQARRAHRILGHTLGGPSFFLCLSIASTVYNSARAGDPVALRAESLTVPPASQPLVYVIIKNLQDVSYRGDVALKGPEDWRFVSTRQGVSLSPGETRRVVFTLEQARGAESNSYPMQVSAIGAGVTVIRRQNIVCATAPYFKPTIDGDIREWKDAIPVAFTSGDKKTVIRTYWNRRGFSLLVSVEEENLISFREAGRFDALQVAISPQDAQTGTSPDDEAARYEFLFVRDGGQTAGTVFLLASPGMKLAETQKARELAPLAFDKARAAVNRDGSTTYYECAVPFSLMRRRIRPGEGREFFLSILVHDPDGTGLRDWGEAAGLWPWQRNRLAWTRWKGAAWDEKPPFDNKVNWGLCSSKY